MIYKVFDAAYPPAAAPAGCQGVLGYIGGRTPHVWTPAEWQRFANLRQFPCWVPDLLNDPAVEAETAVKAAQKLGWAAHESPDTRAIIFDLETASGPAERGWWQHCAYRLNMLGFVDVMYGSLSTVLENAAARVWAAAWDDSATLLPGQTIVAHQYQSTATADYSVIDQWLYDRGGRGARHGVPC